LLQNAAKRVDLVGDGAQAGEICTCRPAPFAVSMDSVAAVCHRLADEHARLRQSGEAALGLMQRGRDGVA